ncbi:MAG: DNA-binding protein, partial [Thermoplasmata archaeon]
MWIGVDDTDSSEGMCTTYLAPQILLKLNLDLIGFPRLVRLNPNIPWKTRGNA